MAKKESLDDGSGLGEVRITIVAVPGRVRSTLSKSLGAGRRVRAGLVCVGVIGAVAAGAVIALSSSSGRARRPLDADALATQVELRLNCGRLTVVLPDGADAEIELDRVGPCVMLGNGATLIVHRRHGVWLRESEASSWTCSMARPPHVAVIELHLCRSNRAASLTGGAVSEIPLDRAAESELIGALERLQTPAWRRHQ